MPYETSPPKLDSFIEEALRNEEIQDGAKRAELEEESLTSTLRGRASEIWEAASSEIETYNQLENKLEATLTELRQAEAVAVEELSFFRRMLLLYRPDTMIGWVWHSLFYIFLLMTLAFVVPDFFPLYVYGAPNISGLIGDFVFFFAPMLLFQRLAHRQVTQTKASTTRGSSKIFRLIVSIAVVASIIAAPLWAFDQPVVAAFILIVFAILEALLLFLNFLSRRLSERDYFGLIMGIAVAASIIAAPLLANQSPVTAVILIVFAVLGALLLLFLNSRSRRLPEKDNNGTS